MQQKEQGRRAAWASRAGRTGRRCKKGQGAVFRDCALPHMVLFPVGPVLTDRALSRLQPINSWSREPGGTSLGSMGSNRSNASTIFSSSERRSFSSGTAIIMGFA